jgi:hypothetical protein
MHESGNDADHCQHWLLIVGSDALVVSEHDAHHVQGLQGRLAPHSTTNAGSDPHHCQTPYHNMMINSYTVLLPAFMYHAGPSLPETTRANAECIATAARHFDTMLDNKT